jgi:protein TonB
MTAAAFPLPVQRRADERLLWVCVAASMLLHAMLMYRMNGVEPAAPMVQEFKATIRTQAPPAPRPAVEPPKPEAVTPEPLKPEPPKPPEPVPLPKAVTPPVAPPIPSKAPPVERKAAPQAPPTPQPATPPPAATTPSASTPEDSKSDAKATPPSTPPTSAAPSAAANGDLKAVIRSYELQLAQAADKFKRYPSEAMQQGWEGTARIKVHIGADGRISSVELVSSSGHDLLDEQAKTTANKAKPFVQIPAELRGQAFSAEIRVVFGLKQ